MIETFLEKRKQLVLSLVFIFAIFLIVFHFTDTPVVWFDEGVYTETAKNLAMHGVVGVQTDPGKYFIMNSFLLSASYPVILPVAASFKLLGAGVWQARLPMLFYMFALVVLFYLFVRKRYGFNTALLSVFSLISFAPFYGNGRPVQGEVAGLVFMVLGAWLLLFLEESDFENKKFAILSGLSFGLCAATKPIFLIVFSVSLCIALLFWIRKIKNKKTLLLFILSFTIPVIMWFLFPFPTKDALLKIIPTYTYLASNHRAQIPVSQTMLLNLKRFFTESTPILFLLLLLCVVVAVLYRYYKKRNIDCSMSEFLIFTYIIFNWFAYLAGTGWYRYFFPAHTLLYLLFPASILSLRYVSDKKVFRSILIGIPVILIIFQFTHLVFFSDVSFVTTRTRNFQLEKAISEVPSDKKILFYGNPEALIFMKGDNYSHYLTIATVMDTKNIEAFIDPSLSYIFGREEILATPYVKCFSKNQIDDKYYLFEKITNCKKK